MMMQGAVPGQDVLACLPASAGTWKALRRAGQRPAGTAKQAPGTSCASPGASSETGSIGARTSGAARRAPRVCRVPDVHGEGSRRSSGRASCPVHDAATRAAAAREARAGVGTVPGAELSRRDVEVRA